MEGNDLVKNALNILEKKVRNLEKRKVRGFGHAILTLAESQLTISGCKIFDLDVFLFSGKT